MSSSKRRHDDTSGSRSHPAKKQRKGFSVGPANLPDGTYKRKVQKIKKELIHKAKLKKKYAKIRERELAGHSSQSYIDEDDGDGKEAEDTPADETAQEPEAVLLELHPDRQRLLELGQEEHDDENQGQDWQEDDTNNLHKGSYQRRRRPKPVPFLREAAEARKQKEEREARQKARAEAEAERQKKIADRERFRKAMAKARSGGPNGKRKLGREGPVILERVKRLVGE